MCKLYLLADFQLNLKKDNVGSFMLQIQLITKLVILNYTIIYINVELTSFNQAIGKIVSLRFFKSLKLSLGLSLIFIWSLLLARKTAPLIYI